MTCGTTAVPVTWPRSVGEHRDDDERAGGAQDLGQVGDDHEGRSQGADGAEQDAEHSPVGQCLPAVPQAQPRCVCRGQQADGQGGQGSERDEYPHRGAPAPLLAGEDAERETGDQGDRAAARDDGQ
jgi:hypothetical protein